MKPFIRKYPVAIFVALTFLFSYGLGLPALWAIALVRAGLPSIASGYLGTLFVVVGPALAAFMVVLATQGSGGVSSWLRGLRLRSRALAWCLLIPVATFVVTVLSYRLIGTSADELWRAIERGWPLLVTHYILQTVVIGVLEELGWRGWMLPMLLQNHSYVGATTRVAAGWCLWHIPKLALGGGIALSFAVTVIALSFLFTLLWASTAKSVLAVAIAHGSHNAPLVFFEGRMSWEATQSAWYVACAFYGLAALLTVMLRWSWWRSRAPREPVSDSACI
jgi:membrane protease YdiL (CAAX protease family)